MKDLIEGLGVPHTEVDLVLVNGVSVGFSKHVTDGDRVSVYPVFEGMDISSVSKVRPTPLRDTRFVVDVHLGRLAGYLRLCGFDTLYDRDWDDVRLAETTVAEQRILLTRDRGLLKRAIVTHGYVVRSSVPREQLEEVLERFDLWSDLQPFTRCSKCNRLLETVTADSVSGEVPPRTLAHIRAYQRCTGCGQVYWKGSHHRSLRRLFSRRGSLAGGIPPTSEERDAQQG